MHKVEVELWLTTAAGGGVVVNRVVVGGVVGNTIGGGGIGNTIRGGGVGRQYNSR